MNKKIVAALSIAVALMSGAASAQTWNCKTEGSWTDAKGSASPFEWTVDWIHMSDAWSLQGSGSDTFGGYSLEGVCGAADCEINQFYSSGPLSDMQYVWSGTYVEKVVSDSETVMSLSGTWAGNDEAGGWSGVGRCLLAN